MLIMEDNQRNRDFVFFTNMLAFLSIFAPLLAEIITKNSISKPKKLNGEDISANLCNLKDDKPDLFEEVANACKESKTSALLPRYEGYLNKVQLAEGKVISENVCVVLREEYDEEGKMPICRYLNK